LIVIFAVLSVIFLNERISAVRAAGILIALAGVMIVIWNPQGLDASMGLLAVLGSASSLAVGAVLLKKLKPISPLRLQAWVALVSWGPLAIVSVLLESNQWQSSLDGSWAFVAALLFSALVVTAWAHTTYFSKLQKYEANLVAPLTLAMPIMTMALGVSFTGDHLDARILAGSALAISGIALVLLAQRVTRPAAMTSRDRPYSS
jgi:drug/metabolite transporter (DMT)-like permease